MKNSKRKSMNRLYARDSKERTGPKSVFTLLTVQCSSLPGLRIGEDGLWSRGGATVVSVGPEAKTHGTLDVMYRELHCQVVSAVFLAVLLS